MAVSCVALGAALVASGCGDDGRASSDRAEKAATASGYPVTIRNCGRALTFDKAPVRVVLPYHPVAEIFVGLGLGDRAVGRAGWDGASPEPPLLDSQAAAFKKIPVVSDDVYPPRKEQMVSLRPDLFLAYYDGDFGGKAEGAKGLATRKELAATGIQAYQVVCDFDGNTESLADVYRAILDLGRIFDVRERAQQRVAQMRRQVAAVRRAVSAKPPVKLIVYTGGTGPLSLVGGGGIVTEILSAAGGENVFAGKDAYIQASREAVAKQRADAFVIIPFSGVLDDLKKAEQFLFKSFPGMPASRNGRSLAIGYEFTTPGWRNAQTVKDLARQLHPEAFR